MCMHAHVNAIAHRGCQGCRVPRAGVTSSCEPPELWSPAKATSVLSSSVPASGSHLQPPFPVFSWPVPIFLKPSTFTKWNYPLHLHCFIYIRMASQILLSEQAMFTKQANAPPPNSRGGR